MNTKPAPASVPGTWTFYARVHKCQPHRAALIRYHAISYGLPVRFSEDTQTVEIHLGTDEANANLLLHDAGFYWPDVVSAPLRDNFPWVPADYNGWINPAVVPVNTPDVYEQAQKILRDGRAR